MTNAKIFLITNQHSGSGDSEGICLGNNSEVVKAISYFQIKEMCEA